MTGTERDRAALIHFLCNLEWTGDTTQTKSFDGYIKQWNRNRIAAEQHRNIKEAGRMYAAGKSYQEISDALKISISAAAMYVYYSKDDVK